MKNLMTIILLTGFFHFGYTQTILSREEALEDIDFFFNTAEQIHPNLYFNITKEDLYKKINSLKSSIGDSISIDDFSKKMRVLANRIGDGHTSISLSADLHHKYRYGVNRFPYRTQIKGNRLFVFCSKSNEVFDGDEILSINDIPTEKLLELTKYTTVDIDRFGVKQLSKFFSLFFFVEYGFQNKVNLKISRNGEIMNKTVQLNRRNTKDRKKYTFLTINDTTGVLRINSFARIYKKNYTKFLNRVFDQINDKKINTLIIDLSRNGGGNSRYAGMLLSYLNVKKYKFQNKFQIKTSKPQKRYMRKRYIKWYMYPVYPLAALSKMTRTLFFKKNGTITEMTVEEEKLKPYHTPFKGKVYVFTSSNTYSAAADFAVAFKYANRGLLVGDTIGQPYTGFIDVIPITLPHSELNAGVSFKTYEFAGATEANKHEGIPPDIYIDRFNYNSGRKLYRAILEKGRVFARREN